MERREMVLEEEDNKKYITELKNRIDDFSDSAKIAVLLNEVSYWHKAAEEWYRLFAIEADREVEE